MANRKSVTNKQLLLLVKAVQADPFIGRENVFGAVKRRHDAKWDKLAEKLNAVPNGAKKSVPKWKKVLNKWRIMMRSKEDSENTENAEKSDDTDLEAARMRNIVRQLAEDNTRIGEIILEVESQPSQPATGDGENADGFRRPEPRTTSRRSRLARAIITPQPYINHQRSLKGLKTIYDNNVDNEEALGRKIVEMQLDRLQYVSEQLVSHIQDVQNRIQMIKDMWQHECIDE